MTSENNDDRIRKAAKRTTPPLPPEVRKRALWAAMVSMRRRSPLGTGIVVAVLLLVLAVVVVVALRGS